ncbi:helix-turn-helix domain-containing protein [Virgibacillus flavescens]|uniref:helix-turn-helix domain-containing protein n=1 Tax=Virgibacillus flavescens TaxID=1611422 RepID=UPI003D335EA5
MKTLNDDLGTVVNLGIEGVSDDFGLLFKEYRKKEGFTLKQLGSMTNVNHTYINRIENGKRREISFSKVIRLAICLKIPFYILISTAFRELSTDGLDQEEGLLTDVLIQHNFVVNDIKVSREIKGILIQIVEFIVDSHWDSKTKVHELYQLSEMIDDLKGKI